jgi:hypothetical protein
MSSCCAVEGVSGGSCCLVDAIGFFFFFTFFGCPCLASGISSLAEASSGPAASHLTSNGRGNSEKRVPAEVDGRICWPVTTIRSLSRVMADGCSALSLRLSAESSNVLAPVAQHQSDLRHK